MRQSSFITRQLCVKTFGWQFWHVPDEAESPADDDEDDEVDVEDVSGQFM